MKVELIRLNTNEVYVLDIPDSPSEGEMDEKDCIIKALNDKFKQSELSAKITDIEKEFSNEWIDKYATDNSFGAGQHDIIERTAIQMRDKIIETLKK